MSLESISAVLLPFLGTTIGEAAVWAGDVGVRPAMWYKP